jgi:alpha-tubulin suppressor-like RCC1 family protein
MSVGRKLAARFAAVMIVLNFPLAIASSSAVDITKVPRPFRPADHSPVVQVASSNSDVYGLLADGTVWALGQGDFGELGNGGTANAFTAPVQVAFPTGVSIAFLATDAMPFDTALAVDTAGHAWGWGLNRNGELCLGNTQQFDLPVELPLTGVTTLAGAAGHAVYDASQQVVSCGTNWNGVLGDGNTASSTVPVPVTGLDGASVTQLVSAFNNAGALTSSGAFYDWGSNPSGQLGNGTTGGHSAVPVHVPIPDASPVTQVAEGGSAAMNGQTLVKLANGTTWAWGNDTWFQLGDGGTTAQPSPVQFFPPPGVTYTALASSGATSYAIDTTGRVWAWGLGKDGQIGNGTNRNSRVPVSVLSGASLISATANDVIVAG